MAGPTDMVAAGDLLRSVPVSARPATRRGRRHPRRWLGTTFARW
ncbi:hypothetical protein O7634_30210 [Micromonospora sp. WMMD1120]|nr:hypothetical protein [Micromonospora sp. WMMD1120]MDG4811055.1 hypothetical protein [Micromonospora sp. WMMD1120]